MKTLILGWADPSPFGWQILGRMPSWKQKQILIKENMEIISYTGSVQRLEEGMWRWR
jgi:hypothetical protein